MLLGYVEYGFSPHKIKKCCLKVVPVSVLLHGNMKFFTRKRWMMTSSDKIQRLRDGEKGI